MPVPWDGIIGAIAIVILIMGGIPIFLSLMIVGLIGYVHLVGFAGLNLLQTVPFREVDSFVLVCLPLFLFMGEIAYYGDLAQEAYRTAHAWLGHFRGGLGMAAVVANTIFAAASGSGMAATATIGSISVPEMRKAGYNPGFAAALCACAGTLAAMIPPSSIMVIYGVYANASIGALLLGGIGPGLVQAFSYGLGLWLISRLLPNVAPAGPRYSWGERFRSLPGSAGLIAIVTMIMAGIYLGVFTPVEAAAFGALGAVVIAALKRRLTVENVRKSLLQTGRVTSMVFMIIIAATVFSYFITLTNLPKFVVTSVTGLNMPFWAIMIVVMFIWLVLGIIMPSVPILMLTGPILLPLATSLGVDIVLFGILFVTVAEIGAYTPPVAFNLFVAHSIAPDIPFLDICKGTIPFLVLDWGRALLILFVPQIALAIPNAMRSLS